MPELHTDEAQPSLPGGHTSYSRGSILLMCIYSQPQNPATLLISNQIIKILQVSFLSSNWHSRNTQHPALTFPPNKSKARPRLNPLNPTELCTWNKANCNQMRISICAKWVLRQENKETVLKRCHPVLERDRQEFTSWEPTGYKQTPEACSERCLWVSLGSEKLWASTALGTWKLQCLGHKLSSCEAWGMEKARHSIRRLSGGNLVMLLLQDLDRLEEFSWQRQ